MTTRAVFPAACLLVLCFGVVGEAEAQPLQFLYDGRKDLKAEAVSNAELLLIRRSALPQARRHWRNNEACEESFETIGAATGSFTNLRIQRAVLYRFCVTGHNFANNGIVIFENGAMLTHVAFNGGEDYYTGAISDLTGDGLSDLVVGNGAMNQGYTNSVIKIITFLPHGINRFGIAHTYEDNCGAVIKGCRALAYRILASPGTAPRFYREVFMKRGRVWTKISGAKPFAPREDEGEYTILN